MPFKPEGDKALWRIAHELFVNVPDGSVVTHNDLAALMGIELRSGRDRQRVWSAAGRARREVQRGGVRRVTVVRGLGYRVEPVQEPLPDDILVAELERLYEVLHEALLVIKVKIRLGRMRDG